MTHPSDGGTVYADDSSLLIYDWVITGSSIASCWVIITGSSIASCCSIWVKVWLTADCTMPRRFFNMGQSMTHNWLCNATYKLHNLNRSTWNTVICLMRAPGALARSNLIDLGRSWRSQLSNGGFGLKIGQLLKKLCLFWPFMIELGSSKLGGALIREGAIYWQNTVVEYDR